jgi:hypothetical protein
MVFANPGKIASVRKAGGWPIGLWGLVVVGACVRPEARTNLDEASLSDAASGVLFRGRSPTEVELIPGDRARWAALEPTAVADGEQLELWLYRCDLEKLRVAREVLPAPQPDPRPMTCLQEGAPCPLGAFRLGEEGWAPTSSRRQPWSELEGDPGRCAVPGPVPYDTVTTPGTGGTVHFLSTFAEGAVLLSASDAQGPGGRRRGLLRAYSLPIQAPLATWTGTTTFISGVRRDDGRVSLVGNDGSTALAERRDGALLVSPTERLPKIATSSCANVLGQEMYPTRGSAMAFGEGETWLVNTCGVLLKRTDDTPWSVAYRPSAPTVLAGPDVALFWAGPGEVYFSDVEREGVLHYRDGVARHEPSEVGAWLTTAITRGDDGHLYAGNFFGELTREEAGRWRRHGVMYPGGITSLAPVGDGFFIGYGVPGIPQIQRGQDCPEALRPAIPSGFARTLLRVDDQVVALLVGEPGWIASFGFEYEPCSPSPKDEGP